MPKRGTLQPVESRGRWKLDVPASVSESGKRERYSFKTRAEAREYAAKISSKDAAAVSPSIASDVERALRFLEGTGATLSDAAREFRELFDRKLKSRLLKDAAEMWLFTSDIEEITRKSYERTVRLLAPLHEKSLAEITPEELAGVMDGWKRASYRMDYGNARTFWLWSARNGWCQAETFERVTKPAKRKIKRAVVLTAGEAEAILRKAEKIDPAMAIAYAVLLFSGLRKREAERLTWEDITDDGIRVADTQSKLDAARFIPWNPPLKAWVEVYRPEDGDLGVLPTNFVNKDKEIRGLCGWKLSSRFLGGPVNPDGRMFPRNAWRKTHASMMIATGHPVQDLIFHFGHAGDLDTLRRFYTGAMTKAEALAIMSIGPHGKKLATGKAA